MQSIIWNINNFRGSYFSLKYSKFDVHYGNVEKIKKIFFDFEIITFELVSLKTRFYWKRILLIASQYANKQSQVSHTTTTEFVELISFPNDRKNMTKILQGRFQQSLRHFNMLTLHNCSDTLLFRHLSNRASSSLYFQKKITYEAHLSSQSLPNFR